MNIPRNHNMCVDKMSTFAGRVGRDSPPSSLISCQTHINGFGDERSVKTFGSDIQIKENPSRPARRGSSSFFFFFFWEFD